jgi:hypothetical protein
MLIQEIGHTLCKLFYPNICLVFLVILQRRNYLCGFVLVLVLTVLVTHNVSGQLPGTIKITQVDAPSTVAAGQQFTVSITVHYAIFSGFGGQYVTVEILDHTGSLGVPYSITASSCNGYLYPNESICSISSGLSDSGVGDLSVDFKLVAPNPQAQFFYLCVYALVMNSMSYPNQVGGGDSKVVTVDISGSVPEFPFTVLPVLIVCLTVVSIVTRKCVKTKSR